MKNKKYYQIFLGIFFLGLLLTAHPSKAASMQNATPQLMYRLRNLHPTVVQKSVIGPKYIYSLQEEGLDTVIRRARKPKHGNNVNFSSKHELRLKDFGHTQTWIYAGNSNWFVGAKPDKTKKAQYYWDTEIARVKFPKGRKTIRGLSKLPRMTHLNYATDVSQADYPKVRRSEAAISPNRKWLLIATVDTNDNGHFALYDLKEVNRALDAAARHANKAVNLKDMKQIAAFHINHLFGEKSSQLNSIQGYEIDNNQTIYISSERKPTKKTSSLPRELVKIPWGATNPKDWTRYKINNSHWHKIATELEGVEIVSSKLALTTAYHQKTRNHRVKENRVYRLNNIVD